MDFYQIMERCHKKGYIDIYPAFNVGRTNDLMVRGKAFYAIWDNDRKIWSTDESDVVRLIDEELEAYKKKREKETDDILTIKHMRNFSTNGWTIYKKYLNQMFDNYHELDSKLTFANTQTRKTDYISKRLPYEFKKGKFEAYEELMSTLYDPEEREKLEWAIGSIIAGDSVNIQKFIVLYGDKGSGKSTFLNIVEKLFDGYYVPFDAKALTTNGNSFALQSFKSNPLVAIQHDGDLSKIEDNTILNSLVSHELMEVNEKYKSVYKSRINSFLFLGSNKPVKITDAKSGLIRRLIDVNPSGRLLPIKKYQALISQIDFELGAIAWHCYTVYQKTGKNYYSSYRPIRMQLQTDVFYNFVEDSYDVFKEQNGVSLKQAYTMYKEYCEDSLINFRAPLYKFREELMSYFKDYFDVKRIDGKQVRSYYFGFKKDIFKKSPNVVDPDMPYSLVLDQTESDLDYILRGCPAQYASVEEKPKDKWSDVTTKLCDLNTTRIHYVKPPLNHIVIDFDLKDSNGEKSLERNLEEASKFPPTYAEYSKSGKGVHLHYIYDGDPTKLSRVYSEGIEVKVFVGRSSLRRKLMKCNNVPIATINSGLPLKGEKMINFDAVKSEKGLRALITRNLNKEIHPGTKPSVDFIHKILEDAYKSGLKYDISDMRQQLLNFAAKSTNHSEYCLKLLNGMKLHSEDDEINTPQKGEKFSSNDLIFFDVEVFPNLFVVVWKAEGKSPVKMINPTAAEIEPLLKMKLVGFNCRRYDNHILYARYLGYDNNQLYNLSQKIING